ncbi:bifunctional methylenetetrahydrofolate dehydrogenase/methenyltetrahydrofolate cyclohydrolase FolD [Brackiella oedipodis]|uniref:bifunctional methylenetetrahydrofolate dehydrogenase/methenyltetrahydrofolate cyclohydrolase FolD n=1 Tax=Brackiella oedipodis TaxID=124225 RepID=UPI0004919FCF|nr:bifunctional methylenetetrahydrofolate dehydrogenase/methenyltetrahydrofolate cyclohydrolase FolD [Brackiella oedipodis]
MNATLIDGKELSARITEQLKTKVSELQAHGIAPSLSVVLVGDDAASQVYVKNKDKKFKDLGLASEIVRLPKDITEAELLQKIQALNEDPKVKGILVQLPLPSQIEADKVIQAIDPRKDVDGFHEQNAGALMNGQPRVVPCTPLGIMYMLQDQGVNLRGAEAVVVGASNIVGKPIALLLQKAGATVTICNSKTRNLKAHTQRADVLVVAVGKPEMIKGDMIKAGAVVIDVGINRMADGKLKGDVEFESARQVAKAITPVPGGVGPMTIAMLVVNTINASILQSPEADTSLLLKF